MDEEKLLKEPVDSSDGSNKVLTLPGKGGDTYYHKSNENYKVMSDKEYYGKVKFENDQLKEYSLSKDSWHMRLLRQSWGLNYYDFTHMCPYFWMCVLSIIIAPYTYLVKLPIIWLFRQLNNWTKEISREATQKEKLKESDFCRDLEFKLNAGAITLQNIAELSESKYHMFLRHLLKNSKDESNYDQYLHLMNLRYEYLTKIHKIKTNKKAEINKMLKRYKWIATLFVNTIMTAGVVIVGVISYEIIKYVILNYNPDIVLAFGACVGTVAAIVGIGVSLHWITKEHSQSMLKILKIVFYPLYILGKGIYELVKLIRQMYSDNCPPINWK